MYEVHSTCTMYNNTTRDDSFYFYVVLVRDTWYKYEVQVHSTVYKYLCTCMEELFTHSHAALTLLTRRAHVCVCVYTSELSNHEFALPVLSFTFLRNTWYEVRDT